VLGEEEMANNESLDETKIKMAFEYYKQQREEMMELGRESMSVAFQVLALMVTFGFGFWQISTADLRTLGLSEETRLYFKIGISVAIMVVGVMGLILNVNIERLRVLHMTRARAARKAIGFLEEFANVGKRTGKTYVFYYFACAMVVVAGGLLLALTLVQG
jgi:hypothetical protein